jgi:hypothetical protein
MIQMKKMAAAVALAAASIGGAQAAALGSGVTGTSTLAAGDLGFSGWIQTSGVYGYGFTTFTDIAAGTDIYFTDMPWKGATGTNGGWSNSTSLEGLYKWTVGAGGVAAGSQLFVSLYTAPVSSITNYVATGVYDNLSFLGSTCATGGCNTVGAANGTTSIITGALTTAGGAASTTNTAIGSSDAFYIYQGGTQGGTASGGAVITVPSISTLLAVGAVTASGGTGDLVTTLGGSSTATTTALDGTGITLAVDTALSKKGIVYKGPTDFTVIGSTIEGVTIVDAATSKLAAQKSFLDTANYNMAGSAAAFSLVATASQTFTGINTNDVQLLSIAAVPEASTYAMLLAGLGMIGFIARRRSV